MVVVCMVVQNGSNVIQVYYFVFYFWKGEVYSFNKRIFKFRCLYIYVLILILYFYFIIVEVVNVIMFNFVLLDNYYLIVGGIFVVCVFVVFGVLMVIFLIW